MPKAAVIYRGGLHGGTVQLRRAGAPGHCEPAALGTGCNLQRGPSAEPERALRREPGAATELALTLARLEACRGSMRGKLKRASWNGSLRISALSNSPKSICDSPGPRGIVHIDIGGLRRYDYKLITVPQLAGALPPLLVAGAARFGVYSGYENHPTGANNPRTGEQRRNQWQEATTSR